MKKLVYLSLALAMSASVAGCNTTPQQNQNAAGGALIGGAAGALIGNAINPRGGALVGGLTGAAAGALMGTASTPTDPGYAPPPRRCAEFYYDYYGNRVCRAYY